MFDNKYGDLGHIL